MNKILFIMLMIATTISAQGKCSIDTSYAIKSTYNKLIKKHPFITFVKSQSNIAVTEIKEVIYQEHKNWILHFDAFLFDKLKNNPAVIMMQDGGRRSGNKNKMQDMASEMASKSYSCLAIEYRFSPEVKYPGGVYDVKNAIEFIKDNAVKFNVDPDKIALLGCSSGAQMAALIGTTNENLDFEDKSFKSKSSSKVQAIIDVDGVLAFKHPKSSEGDVASFWLGGAYDEKPENWKNASALNHTNKGSPSILLINSSFSRFHIGRDDMITIFNQYKIYSEVKTIENSPN